MKNYINFVVCRVKYTRKILRFKYIFAKNIIIMYYHMFIDI